MSLNGCYWVIPCLPTILEGRSEVELPGYELWTNFINNVHVLYGILDLDRFQTALSKTLQLYPHAAGRLTEDQGRFTLKLTQSAIPIDVEHVPNDLFEALIINDWVIQDNITRLLSQKPKDTTLVNGDAPLLRFKLTFCGHRTSVGVSWNHTLGDATVLLRFIHTLSLSYQGLISPYPTPTFSKYLFSLPSPSLLSEYLPYMPHLRETFHIHDLGEKYSKANGSMARVDWRINAGHLEVLRNMALEAVSDHDNKVAAKITTQDCLTAYIVNVLNRCLDSSIRMVTNAASYRHSDAPFVHPDVAGNMIYIVRSEVIPPFSKGVGTIATVIRKSIIEWRQTTFIRNWISAASYLMHAAALEGKLHFFLPQPDVLAVNSNLSLDWRVVNFGFPESSQFFTSGVSKFYLRTFKSNSDSESAVDVSFGVPKGYESKVLDALTCDLEHPRFPRNVQL